MIATSDWLWELDGWIVAAGVLCAVASSLVGNFLVLRRSSLLGDAISHAVLPGLAVAFLITGSRQSLPMFIGAVIVGILTAALTQGIRDSGKIDEGASMGVVFTTLFALGLVLIVRAADRVDLDPGCVLYGAIELTPLDTVPVGSLEVPRVVITLGVVSIINLAFVVVFFKELRLTSFDPALADAIGFRSQRLHYLLMTLVAVTAVASFESVGNILVVAMFVVPAATARLLTDRLGVMVGLSAVLAAAAAVIGHWSAITVPRWFGYTSTTTAGMMAVASGGLLVLAIVIGPRQGVLPRLYRRWRLAGMILRDDLLALLFRSQERRSESAPTAGLIRQALPVNRWRLRLALWNESRAGRIESVDGGYRLTPVGRLRASSLVRAHRLWEQYLVDRAGVTVDRIHQHAERFEHFADRDLRDQLERETEFPSSDPHGSPIPSEENRDNPSSG